MNDIRRSILWVVFGFSMILIWDKWQIHNGKQPLFFPTQQAAAEAKANADAKAPAANGDSSVPTAAATGSAASAVPGAASPAAPAAKGEPVTVRTDVYELTFNTEGGSLVGVKLLKHDKNGQTNDPVQLLTETAEHTYVAQSGLVGADNLPNHKTVMSLVPGPMAMADGQNELQVKFEATGASGVKVVKAYTLHRGRYDIEVSNEVSNGSSAPVTPKLYVQLVRDGNEPKSETPFYSTFTGPAVYSSESKYQKIKFEDIKDGDAKFAKTANDGYVAMVQHYFASAWVLPSGTARENFAVRLNEGNNLYSVGSLTTLPALAPGQAEQVKATLFVGPQEEHVLEAVTQGLDLVKDYGWLAMLAKPLYSLLSYIHKFVGNWGWSIILLVVLIKAAFYWLNASAYRSMAKMKAINPRIQEMRERLKDKPQLMQQEMMKMYREEKVNPLGGCLPIMIQIPVFISLYWVLSSSVEMRNAPWMLWITDLSAKDPFFILPVIMTLTTVIQTALNPLPPDPMQAKMMWLMPLMFSVMFFFFPAGLVLYWITNNTLTILQQAFINHRMGVPLKFNMPKFG